jgi:GT2 family glycosyltransferase
MPSNKNFSVSVVMPILNGEKLLEKNLFKLMAAKKNPQNNISEVIIVDDGSWDESAKLLKKKFPEIRLFKHKINRGLPAAINTGVRAAKGELILLIHADVIPEKDFLVSVFKGFKDKRVFAVSSHVQGRGPTKGKFSAGFVKTSSGVEQQESCQSFYVSDGCGVFRREIWMELSGMDEKLFSPFYWEDRDICYRAEKRGYINIWEPESNVIHIHESAINKFPKSYVDKVWERNRLLFVWKNISSPALIRKHLIGILRKSVKSPAYLKIVFMALSKLGVALDERKREIKLSKVSDEAIFARFE